MYRWLTPLAPFVQLHKIASRTLLGISTGFRFRPGRGRRGTFPVWDRLSRGVFGPFSYRSTTPERWTVSQRWLPIFGHLLPGGLPLGTGSGRIGLTGCSPASM